MINRRTFALGALGLATGLPPARALAEIRVNGRLVPDKGRKLRDIPYTPLDQIPNHRQYMRDIVIALSSYAKARNPHLVILARDAPELLVKGQREWDWETGRDNDGAAEGKYTPVGSVIRPYLKAIDGMLFDGLFCGKDAVDQPTDEAAAKPLLATLAMLQKEGRHGISIEYAKDLKQAALAAKKAEQAKLLSYVDQDGDRLLGRIPRGRPPLENPRHVRDLESARNYLPMLHSTSFGSRDDWVNALAATNYDMLLIDPFWRGTDSLTKADVTTLKLKRLGSDRLLFADLPVGRALDTRFYWKPEWSIGSPGWLVAPDPDSAGHAIVRYWETGWKEIIGQYMQGLVDLGVDGILLSDLDAYFYFEDMMPLR
jgi:endo-alpha-1,4-polygalactosaminidase (GH114 family)